MSAERLNANRDFDSKDSLIFFLSKTYYIYEINEYDPPAVIVRF
jgi:hypothetical protein